MRKLSIDIETYSSTSIKSCGMYKYVQSPAFEVLLFAYAFDDDPVTVIDLVQGETIPAQVTAALFDSNVTKHAFNAAFEWYALSKYFNLTQPLQWLAQWRCTMLHSLYCGYPSSLEEVGKAIGHAEDKKKMIAGKALIRTFCVPCEPKKSNGFRSRTLPHHEPEKWELFKRYNALDVVAEREIENKLAKFPVPEDVRAQWLQDMAINYKGVAIDLSLVEGALYCSESSNAALTGEAMNLSGLNNPNSVKQLTDWLDETVEGLEVKSLDKAAVADLIETVEDNTVKRVLEIRQELSKTSVKKYTTMQNTVCADGRVRGLLQFYGANRTGRWAGRLVQVQNLPKNRLPMLDTARELTIKKKLAHLKVLYGTVPDTLSQLIRTAFVPKEGHCFLVADFSAIEARVIAWLAGEQWVSEVFATHGKIYEATAAQMFGVPIELISKGNPEYELRQKGKVSTLALGYQGSTGALLKMGALHMGLTEEELPDIVRRWRTANRRIVDLWYAVENAALETVKTGHPTGVRGLLFALEGDYDKDIFFLTVKLPSGRKLYYVKPHLVCNDRGRESLRYYGVQQGETASKRWGPIDTYGGKLVENIVQAIARDCLACSLDRLTAAGYNTVFHVHDEVILEQPTGTPLEPVLEILGRPIPWASGLILKAEGFVTNYYKKED